MTHLEVEKYYIGNFDEPGFSQRLPEQIFAEGLAVFDGMHEPDQLRGIAEMLDGTIHAHVDAGDTGITRLTASADADPTVRSSVSTFNTELNLHTDGTRTPNPADLLALYCEQPAERGGISMYASAPEMHHYMEQEYPELLDKLYQPWLFGTEDDGYTAPVFEAAGNHMTIRFRRDSYDNYEEPMRQVLDEIIAEMTLNGITRYIRLEAGQGVVLNNRGGMLHGRTPIYTPRTLVRANVDVPAELREQLGFKISP